MEQSFQRLKAVHRVQVWAERIAECRSSGKSVRAWCREKEISEKTYYYWQRRLYQQMISAAEGVDFVEIPREVQTEARVLALRQKYACLEQQSRCILGQILR